MALQNDDLSIVIRDNPNGSLASLLAATVANAPTKDDDTSAWVFLDEPHFEIHEGHHFSKWNLGTKNNGQTINIYIKTPNTAARIHSLTHFSCSGAAYLRIYESPTVTSNTGTNGGAIYNNDRNSSTTSVVLDNATTPAANKAGLDVTVTAAGTTIFETYTGVAKQVGGNIRSDDEFILKQNTAYVFEVTADANSLVLGLFIDWYEV